MRTFWAAILLPDEAVSDVGYEHYVRAIIKGTDPDGAEYWGELESHDQFAVEMPILALSLVLARDKVWNGLRETERHNIGRWLYKINDINIPDNNWNSFVIVVNVCLKLLGLDYCELGLIKSIRKIDSYYAEGGWYVDGSSKRVDYYVAFSIHFYLLIVRAIYPQIEEHIAVRARVEEFAAQYARMFSNNGDALPYGRSLSYRFAQASFWGALAFADIEALPWGEIRGLYARNIRYWSNKDIISSDGLLTVGYDYPNDLLAEYYIGSGSPYWAFSAFIAFLAPVIIHFGHVLRKD
jgi:hypothetical protein